MGWWRSKQAASRPAADLLHRVRANTESAPLSIPEVALGLRTESMTPQPGPKLGVCREHGHLPRGWLVDKALASRCRRCSDPTCHSCNTDYCTDCFLVVEVARLDAWPDGMVVRLTGEVIANRSSNALIRLEPPLNDLHHWTYGAWVSNGTCGNCGGRGVARRTIVTGQTTIGPSRPGGPTYTSQKTKQLSEKCMKCNETGHEQVRVVYNKNAPVLFRDNSGATWLRLACNLCYGTGSGFYGNCPSCSSHGYYDIAVSRPLYPASSS